MAGVEAIVVTPVRILVAQSRGDWAMQPFSKRQSVGVDAAWQLAEKHGIGWLRLRLHIAQSLIAEAGGDHDAALRSLAAAVAEAEPEGIIRPFLDEGAPMAALLADLRAGDRRNHHGLDRRYVARLPRHAAGRLHGPETAAGHVSVDDCPEPARTLQRSSSRSARGSWTYCDYSLTGDPMLRSHMSLFVEQSTVKTHLIHLYRKLGVSSRTQAINRARTLRLLD